MVLLLLVFSSCAPTVYDYLPKKKPIMPSPTLTAPTDNKTIPVAIQPPVPAPDLSIHEGLDKGDRISDFKFPQYGTGQEISLYSYLGKKVFINLWSTYCGACINDLPTIQDFYISNKDVIVLTICLDGRADRVDKAMQKYTTESTRWTFPILLDEDKILSTDYRPWGMPTSYALNEKAVVTNVRVGAFGSISAIETFCK